MKIKFIWNEAKVSEFSKRLEKVLFERQEDSLLHNSFIWSESLFEAICSGDEERVRKIMEQEIQMNGQVGTLAKDWMRNAKNLMICYVANLTYRMIRDQALDEEIAYSISDEKIVIDQMTEQLGTSASYLGLIFKKSEGMTLHQFIMQEKLERGKNLLRYSDYDLHTISQYLGFASQSHFGREFKKYTGDTPAAYRSRKNQLYREKL